MKYVMMFVLLFCGCGSAIPNPQGPVCDSLRNQLLADFGKQPDAELPTGEWDFATPSRQFQFKFSVVGGDCQTTQTDQPICNASANPPVTPSNSNCVSN